MREQKGGVSVTSPHMRETREGVPASTQPIHENREGASTNGLYGALLEASLSHTFFIQVNNHQPVLFVMYTIYQLLLGVVSDYR